MYQRKNVKLNTDKSTKEKGRKKGRDTNNSSKGEDIKFKKYQKRIFIPPIIINVWKL